MLPSWSQDGTKSRNDPKEGPKSQSFGSPPESFGPPQAGAPNRSKPISRAIRNSYFCLSFWASIFWAIWCNLATSWLQNRYKLGCWFERCFLMNVEPAFIDFLPQHGMAEVAKTADSCTHFYSFCYFSCWAVGLAFWLIFDWFSIDFGVENLSKIDQKSVKKIIKNQLPFWIDFGRLLDRFWDDFGANLGANLGPSWSKNQTQMDIKIMSKKVLKKWDARLRRVTQGYATKVSREGEVPL